MKALPTCPTVKTVIKIEALTKEDIFLADQAREIKVLTDYQSVMRSVRVPSSLCRGPILPIFCAGEWKLFTHGPLRRGLAHDAVVY